MGILEEESPFERMLGRMLSGDVRSPKIEDIHPEDFRLLMDAIVTLFFNQNTKKGRKVGLEGLTDYEGVRTEFSSDIQYPFTRKDRIDNFKVIVLPENDSSEELKQLRVRETLKEFDCLETVEKYELCLRILHTFSEKELIELAKQHDPFKRDTSKLEERLNHRALKREKRE